MSLIKTGSALCSFNISAKALKCLRVMLTPRARGSNQCIPHSFVPRARLRRRCKGHTLKCLTLQTLILSFRLYLVDSFFYLYITHGFQVYKALVQNHI